MNNITAIDGMEGHEFERFCAKLLEKVGFTDVKVTPGSGDQGVDVLATKDGIKYAIQCKNYSRALSNTPVQEVAAGKIFYGCHVAVVMTNSTFTPGAVELAKATNVLLWDRTKLKELIWKAGGLEKFGYATYNDPGSENISNRQVNTNSYYASVPVQYRRRRTGMRILASICFWWCVICFLMMMAGLFTNEKIMLEVGVGEGLFVLVLGIMFKMLEKTEKENPCISIFGMNIKKQLFVIVCIVIAYVFFIGALALFGEI